MNIENNGVVQTDGMSKLVYWEVWNFMCFSHAKFEFDDDNIINLVGYNNSGKSAALRALEVNMYNRFPKSQLSFIKSGADHFRVVTVWSDGVVIMRDKYSNGQNLYEMWRGEECLYSTKQNGVLTKVDDVPICIQEYLNLVKFEDSYLNSRSCFEKQFLVQTTGGENYSALNTVLKSEELSLAGSLVNADRNKLASDINVAETTYNVKMAEFKEGLGLTEDLINTLKSHDKLLDDYEVSLSSLGSLLQLSGKLSEIPELPAVESIGWDELQLLDIIVTCQDSINSLYDIPNLSVVDDTQLSILSELYSLANQLKGIADIPAVSSISDERLSDILSVQKACLDYKENEDSIAELNGRINKLGSELEELESNMREFGVQTVRCKNCGSLVEVGGVDNETQCCSL